MNCPHCGQSMNCCEGDQADPMLDLIHANQEEIVRIQREGISRIRQALLNGDVDLANKVLSAVSTFHPMHPESWVGWPDQGLCCQVCLQDVCECHLSAFDVYQRRAMETAVYPDRGKQSLAAISYCILGLNEEAGEIAGKMKKVIRDGASLDTIKPELGDCLWYLQALCGELGLNLSVVAGANLIKLAARKAKGTVHGQGDGR